jgi:hypothetical protein
MATWMIDAVSDHMDGAPSTVPDIPTDTTKTTTTDLGLGTLWWERVHVWLREISLGNLVAQVVVTLDINNAYRADDRTWDSLIVNADGVTTDAPSLPITLDALESTQIDVTIAIDGAASVDGDLTFTFEGPEIVIVPISFLRLSAFVFEPEDELVEELEWNTKISAAASGKEKRQSIRRIPRQRLRYQIERWDDEERDRIENFLFDQAGKIVGVPFWPEQTKLSSAASATDTTLNVTTTSYMDFRVGGQAIVFSSETVFEIVNVSAVNPTSLDLSTALSGNFAAGIRVLPLRTAIITQSSSKRRRVGGARYKVDFLVTDNDLDIADTSAFSTYDSKVLLDGSNFVDNVQEKHSRIKQMIDSETGQFTVHTLQAQSYRHSAKGFVTKTPQALWEVRQLLHALRGKHVSFYLPTFASEFVATQPTVATQSNLDISHVGYTDFAQSRAPRNVLRLVEADGTEHKHEITNATELSATEERLTLTPVWSDSIPLVDINFVDVVEKVRFDSDVIAIRHNTLPGQAEITAPVRSVIE